jgi:hypothetical protein
VTAGCGVLPDGATAGGGFPLGCCLAAAYDVGFVDLGLVSNDAIACSEDRLGLSRRPQGGPDTFFCLAKASEAVPAGAELVSAG